MSDMAGYSCVAENKVGTVEKLFSLKVQGKKKSITKKASLLPLYFQFLMELEWPLYSMSFGSFITAVIGCSLMTTDVLTHALYMNNTTVVFSFSAS